MANLPEALAQFEYQKMQLIGSLGAVAETMRNCATIADQFAQLVSQVPYNASQANGQLPVIPNTPLTGRGKRKAAEQGDGRRVKRAKKPRDPNAPKRPASSYILFQNEVRQQLKDKNPNLPNNELLSLIAKMWKDMPREEKDAYEARQKLATEEWMANKIAYKATQVANQEPPVLESPVIPEQFGPVPTRDSSDESSDDENNSSASFDASDDHPGRKSVQAPQTQRSSSSTTEKNSGVGRKA
ncbi:HMG-box [Panus rudis PR-1116 ss-1]|nr:HMG-box [Panus rudis PR-1116 ss-1]